MYNPEYTNCDCNIIEMVSMFPKNKSNLSEIINHVYNHLMTNFIPTVCSMIVSEYIGEIPCYRSRYVCSSGDIMTHKYYSTLGIVCINDGYKSHHEYEHSKFYNICTVIRCQSPILIRSKLSLLCNNHLTQWIDYWNKKIEEENMLI
jgi:hypothetical protein